MSGRVRILKSKEFARYARKSAIEDSSLCRAVFEIHAGSIDANLGGGVYKQRLRRMGEGKSGGFRTIILIRLRKIAIFVSGFSKSEKANITTEDLAAFRHIAKGLLTSEAAVTAALVEGKLIEVVCEETATVS